MTQDDVIKKVRGLKIDYISQGIGSNPAALPQHLAEFLGYATLLYDFQGDKTRTYKEQEAKVIQEETAAKTLANANAHTKEDRVTVAELEQRIAVRLSNLSADLKRIELITKGATLHINGCQSLIKSWGDEAKGIR